MMTRLFITIKTLFLFIVFLTSVSCSSEVQSNAEKNQSDSFSFVFITDIHLDYDSVTLNDFDNAVRTINMLNPDFIITGGDNVKDATHPGESYADSLYNLYASQIERFNMPVYTGIGNHEVFGVNNPEVNPENPLYGKKMYESRIGERYYAFSYNGWKFFMIDDIKNTDTGHKYIGFIDDEQMAWLENELAATDSMTPIVITSHIPFISSMKKFELGSLSGNPVNDGVENSIEFFNLFSNHNLKLLLQGHFHFFEVLYTNDIYYITGPSLNRRYGSQLTRKTGLFHFTVRGDSLIWKFIEN
jgi:Icc protein